METSHTPQTNDKRQAHPVENPWIMYKDEGEDEGVINIVTYETKDDHILLNVGIELKLRNLVGGNIIASNLRTSN